MTGRSRWASSFFLVLTVIVLAHCNVRCSSGGSGRAGTAGFTPMASTGPEIWTANGATWHIESTYFLVLPKKTLQYTIEYHIEDPRLLEGITDERALTIAMPIMQYAYKRRLFERVSVTALGDQALRPSMIGVAITYRDGPRSRGYRVSRTISQVAETLSGSIAVDAGMNRRSSGP